MGLAWRPSIESSACSELKEKVERGWGCAKSKARGARREVQARRARREGGGGEQRLCPTKATIHSATKGAKMSHPVRILESTNKQILCTPDRRPVESKTRTHYGPVGSGRRTAARRGRVGLGRTERRRDDPARRRPSLLPFSESGTLFWTLLRKHEQTKSYFNRWKNEISG